MWSSIPSAPYKVSYNDSNQKQSEDLVKVKHHVLGYNFFISWGGVIREELLQNFVESTDIDQLDKSGQSQKSKELGNLPCFDKPIKWKDWDKVDEEPSFEHVLFCDFS